jgi:biotin synthase-related radical SAM superfamily protein
MNNKRIEGYLKKSTRGLWGRKCAEVREELSVHIEGRVNAHLIAGLSESEAVEKTLVELGRPANVSNGMARVYTLPTMASSGVMFAKQVR